MTSAELTPGITLHRSHTSDHTDCQSKVQPTLILDRTTCQALDIASTRRNSSNVLVTAVDLQLSRSMGQDGEGCVMEV
ncbi:hypothetical protein WMY93_022250 [Mugilogobius chulae]|uniref:Uncharacterized protein n=1 Tax=Mugilogobius chulae TaxID=88201 RepID=A0AAW0N7K0_9GOBI